jgi:hypothetical protein
MKKIMVIFTIVMLAGICAYGQDEQKVQNKNTKIFLSLSGGPSFPVGNFASKDTSNEAAGLAKTGYHINLHLGYQFHENFGIISTFLYSKYKLDMSDYERYGISTDHWQYYGVMIGPMLTYPINEKAKFDLKIMGGITNVNSPNINTNISSVYVKEDWSTSFVMQLGMDLRYNVTKNLYLVSNLDYNYMKPKFEMNTTVGDGNLPHQLEQKISAVNLNIGIGVSF